MRQMSQVKYIATFVANIINMEVFSERLIYLRLEQGLTQEQLAEKTGLTRSAIGLWEKGKRVPNALAVIALARYFGVTCGYLLGEENE